MPNHNKELAICDANVLIDYATTDEDIIREVALYWKKVYVPDCVLREVKQLSEERAKELGLTILETPFGELPYRKNLSVQDSACLYYVEKKKMVCLTNDVALRKACIQAGAEVVWGLQMLLYLVEKKQIVKARAKDIAGKIHKANPEITTKIYIDYLDKLKML